MAASTISVTPAGMGSGGGGNVFGKIGNLLKSAQKRAIQGRNAADSEIDRLSAKIEADKEAGEPVDKADEQQLKYLQGLRSKENKGYFFKQALGFSATDRLKTTLGKFQRDPSIESDPAATEKERFFARTGITRPDMLPDTSNREAGQDMMTYIGQGFQAITDAINRVGARLKSVSASTASVASTVNKTVNSTETLGKSSKDLADVSEEETDLKRKELDNYKDAQEDAQVEAEASSRRGILDVARSVNIKEVGLGAAKGIGGRLLGGLGSVGGRFLRRRRGRTAFSSPIGPLPMNSSQPWAKAGPGEMGNAAGFVPRLSQGGIIQPKMLTNPTKISSRSFAAIPTQRPEGRELLSGTKRDSDNMGKMFSLGPIISGGMTFATMGMLASSNPLIGAVLNTARPVLEPIAEAFGFPPSILNILLGRKPSGDGKENQRPSPTERPRPRPNPPPNNDPSSDGEESGPPPPDVSQVQQIREKKLSAQDIPENFGMKTHDTFNFSIPGGGTYKAYKTAKGFEIFKYGGIGSLIGREQRIDTSGGKNARVVQALIEEGNRRVGRTADAKPLVPPSGIQLKKSDGTADTGSGYSPVGPNGAIADANRRPLIFSQQAGNAFIKMYNDSKGAIKGSDIHSTQRSQAKNAMEGGAVGSLHIRGMAMDVHGDSQQWIKEHGAKYGWVYAPYPGQSHDGHFIYNPSVSETQLQSNSSFAPIPVGKQLSTPRPPSSAEIAMLNPIVKPAGTPTITGESSTYPVSASGLKMLNIPAFIPT